MSAFWNFRKTGKGQGYMKNVWLPLGLDNFEELRKRGYYYIDKTKLIEELLTGGYFKVNLINRPRRFGKTLTMSMLADFLISGKTAVISLQGLR